MLEVNKMKDVHQPSREGSCLAVRPEACSLRVHCELQVTPCRMTSTIPDPSGILFVRSRTQHSNTYTRTVDMPAPSGKQHAEVEEVSLIYE